MNEVIAKCFADIEKNINDDYMCDYQEKLVEQLKTIDEKDQFIKPILELMEKYPLAYFGMPGELVSFIESCDMTVYENALIESLERQPSATTVECLNRLINGSSKEKKEQFIQILYSIKDNENIPNEITDLAKEFIDYQESIEK